MDIQESSCSYCAANDLCKSPYLPLYVHNSGNCGAIHPQRSLQKLSSASPMPINDFAIFQPSNLYNRSHLSSGFYLMYSRQLVNEIPQLWVRNCEAIHSQRPLQNRPFLLAQLNCFPFQLSATPAKFRPTIEYMWLSMGFTQCSHLQKLRIHSKCSNGISILWVKNCWAINPQKSQQNS